METLNGSQILIKSLLREGVDRLFGYPGGSIMPLYDELYHFKDTLNHILVRHEQGAVHAAQGYSRASGRVSVCMATAGPGATNLITGIADAYADSTPVVCIAAQVPHDKLGSNFFQEADIISLTVPITKWNYQITSPDEIQEVVAKAFYIARSGRPGPVLLSITRDCQAMSGTYDAERKFNFNIPTLSKWETTNNDIGRAAEWINGSQKPLIISGQGVTLSGAEEQLLSLCERGEIPVATTLMGISSIPTGHRLFAGNVGMHGSIAANYMTQQSDLIVALGMRFSDRVTGNLSKYAPKAKIIHVDIDKSEFNKCVKSHLQLHGDVGHILNQLLPHITLNEGLKADRGDWLKYMAEYREKERIEVAGKLFKRHHNNSISMAQVINAICEEGKGEQIIVTDVGQNQMFSALYSQFSKKRSFITSGGLGTMGFGLPAGIGAAVAMPDKKVVSVLGDGGFQMTMQELGTIMQNRVNLKIVILNNSYLGMVRQWQELFFGKRYSATPIENPSFNTIASAYNFKNNRITYINDLKDAVKSMMLSDGPYLLEVVVRNEENVFPMVPAGASLDDLIY